MKREAGNKIMSKKEGRKQWGNDHIFFNTQLIKSTNLNIVTANTYF